MIKKARKNNEIDIAQKAEWSFIKSKTKIVQGIPDIYTDNTKTTKGKTVSEKAQILSKFFTSVYISKSSNNVLPVLEKRK